MASLILLGIKHCGKSTQARLLGKRLELPVFDTDSVLFEQTGRMARDIYLADGEEAFAAAELNACRFVREQLESAQHDGVIATGGGICRNKAALDVLHPLGLFIFLQAPESVAVERIVREARFDSAGGIKNVPAYIAKKNPQSLDDVRTIFHDFYTERVACYEALADVSVRMGSAPKKVNTERILAALKTVPQ